MAKIVYGVSGEGSGHSSRPKEKINHLEHLGPIVKVVSYDRGYRNLKDDFKENLAGYRAEDNSQIKAKLEELLKNDCALSQEYHRKRSSKIH